MNLLTPTESRSNLATLSERIANRHGNLSSQGVSDYTIKGVALFLCPKSIMVGVLGSIRACWILDPVYQPGTSTAQSLVTSDGSLKTIVKELAMLQHRYKQNSSTNHTPSLNVRLKSFFILMDSSRKVISDNLSFDQAILLKNKASNSIIKFQRFEKIGVVI